MDVSFVIPVKNESGTILKCLSSVSSQFYNGDLTYELIIVDDHSTDGTIELVKTYKGQYVSIYSLVGITGPAAARNLGAFKAKGDILVFLDGDIVLSKSWYNVLAENFMRIKNTRCLTGSQVEIDPLDKNWVVQSWFSNRIYPNYINSGHLIISKNTFLELDGFDQNLETGEDSDISQRARIKGIQVFHITPLKAIHLRFPKDLVGFLKRERWHGKGNWTKQMLKSKMTIFIILYWLGFILSPISFATQSISLALASLLAYKKCGFNEKFLQCFVLANVLLVARGISLVDVIIKKIKR